MESQLQTRYDGFLGFAGGSKSKTETIIDSLKRELLEELTKRSEYVPGMNDLSRIYIDRKSGFCDYFFARRVDTSQIRQLMRETPNSTSFGTEIMGISRISLKVHKSGNLEYFLTMPLIGNTLQQILDFLKLNNSVVIDELFSRC